MASPSLYPEFETHLMSNRKDIELVLQLKSAKTHGKNYIKVRPPLIRHLYRNRLLSLASILSFWHMETKQTNRNQLYSKDAKRPPKTATDPESHMETQ